MCVCFSRYRYLLRQRIWGSRERKKKSFPTSTHYSATPITLAPTAADDSNKFFFYEESDDRTFWPFSMHTLFTVIFQQGAGTRQSSTFLYRCKFTQCFLFYSSLLPNTCRRRRWGSHFADSKDCSLRPMVEKEHTLLVQFIIRTEWWWLFHQQKKYDGARVQCCQEETENEGKKEN